MNRLNRFNRITPYILVIVYGWLEYVWLSKLIRRYNQQYELDRLTLLMILAVLPLLIITLYKIARTTRY